MTDDQKYQIHLILTHMDCITAEINDVGSKIESMISSDSDYANAIQLLTTISGVKHDSTITIISEIGTDISQFCSQTFILLDQFYTQLQ